MKRLLNKLYKSICVLAAIAVCASFAACSPQPGDKTPTPDTQTKIVSSIEITTNPVKTEYFVGEMFDPAGMVVTAKYTDGTSAAVTDYKIGLDRALTKADSLVEITYGTRKKYVNITVKDKVITGTEYVFQAEAAKLEGTVSSGTHKDKALACYNIVQQAHADGGAMINNFNVQGNTVSWTVSSDKACEANLTVVVAARCKKTGGKILGQTVAFDDMFGSEVNGEAIAFCTDVVPTNGHGNESVEYGYFELHEVSSNIKLNSGDNTIKLTASEVAGNLDCIKITADATLADKTVGIAHNFGGMKIITDPTETAEGEAGDLCSVCYAGEKKSLPALNKTDYTYTLVKEATSTEDGLETYTYDKIADKDGKPVTVKVVIPATNKSTYRLEAEKASIAGTSASGSNKGEAVSCANIIEKEGICSENKCLTGMNKAGNTVKFSVDSDKATTATLLIRVSARVSSKKGYTVKFKDMYTLSVGGTAVEIPDDVAVTPTDGNGAALTDYYQFHDVRFDISLTQDQL